jgi:hypothetical protein
VPSGQDQRVKRDQGSDEGPTLAQVARRHPSQGVADAVGDRASPRFVPERFRNLAVELECVGEVVRRHLEYGRSASANRLECRLALRRHQWDENQIGMV